jgi:hypothetical protein
MGPGASWLALIADKKAEPNVPIIAIINPLSGPSIFNATYLSYIDQLRIANITVIGYVYTDYGNRALSAVESDITTYYDYYPLNGIFVDNEVDVGSASAVSYFTSLAKFIRTEGGSGTLSVGNPGTFVPSALVGIFNRTVIYENKGFPTVSTLIDNTLGYPKSYFAIIVYGITNAADVNSSYIQEADTYVSDIFVTNSPTATYNVASPYVASIDSDSVTTQAATSSTTTSTTTSVNPCATALCSTTTPQKVPYSIPKGQFGVDLGPVTWRTTLTGFQWNSTDSASLRLGLPTVGPTVSLLSSILYNNSVTSLQPTNTNVKLFFKPQGYSNLITITGVSTGLQTCLAVVATGGTAAYNKTANPTFLSLGNLQLSWSDIPSADSPSYGASGLCYTPPIGTYSIDPIAIDGSGKCSSGVAHTCTITLSTSNTNDVIIVVIGLISSHPTASTPIDTSLLSWSTRASISSGTYGGLYEFYAISSGTLSSDVITCANSNVNGRISCNAFGISGANTVSPFDPASACTNNGNTGTTASCTLTTTNTNDMCLILGGMSANVASPAPLCNTHTGTLIQSEENDGNGGAYSAYYITSSTFIGGTIQYTITSGDPWSIIGDAIQQAITTVVQPINVGRSSFFGGSNQVVTITGSCLPSPSTFTGDNTTHNITMSPSCSYGLSLPSGYVFVGGSTGSTCSSGTCSTASFVYRFTTVIQGIKLTVAESAPQAVFGISGCGVSNSTFTAHPQGYTTVYTGLTPSCSITITQPTPGSFSIYNFNVSPHPTTGASITFTTCAGGTCSVYSNTTYYQLGNYFGATPQTPSTWDGTYSWTLTGTFLGVTGFTYSCSSSLVSGTGGVTYCYGVSSTLLSDYNQPVTYPSTIGNTWNAQAPKSFSPTTASNHYNVNYIQSTGGGGGGFNLLWLMALPGALILAVAVKRRR